MAETTVFDFLELQSDLPQTITIERTLSSKYLFYQVVRHYKQILKKKPRCVVYSKSEASLVKGTMEEYSLFGEDFYVLEGFSSEFMKSLSLPSGVYCVAETDSGELKAPLYTQRMKRDILKSLIRQLDLSHSLRGLLKLDWATCRDYPDFEVVLRRANVLKWNESDLAEELSRVSYGHLLVDLKRADYRMVVSMVERYGAQWTWNHLTSLVNDLILLKAFKVMGYEDERIQREMDLSWSRSRELMESHRILTRDEVISLAKKMFVLDYLFSRDREQALNIVIFSGIPTVMKQRV